MMCGVLKERNRRTLVFVGNNREFKKWLHLMREYGKVS